MKSVHRNRSRSGLLGAIRGSIGAFGVMARQCQQDFEIVPKIWAAIYPTCSTPYRNAGQQPSNLTRVAAGYAGQRLGHRSLTGVAGSGAHTGVSLSFSLYLYL